jgi:hypothetical protein
MGTDNDGNHTICIYIYVYNYSGFMAILFRKETVSVLVCALALCSRYQKGTNVGLWHTFLVSQTDKRVRVELHVHVDWDSPIVTRGRGREREKGDAGSTDDKRR